MGPWEGLGRLNGFEIGRIPLVRIQAIGRSSPSAEGDLQDAQWRRRGNHSVFAGCGRHDEVLERFGFVRRHYYVIVDAVELLKRPISCLVSSLGARASVLIPPDGGKLLISLPISIYS